MRVYAFLVSVVFWHTVSCSLLPGLFGSPTPESGQGRTSNTQAGDASSTDNNASGFSQQAAGEIKPVYAHFMVGNTYPYTAADWRNDISLAYSKGISGFALNVGRDPWQPDRVATAYSVASTISSSFKLFLSFDMTSLPCDQLSDKDALRKYITDYASHPNQAMYNGGSLVGTFAGEYCRFGRGSLAEGWLDAVKANGAAGFPHVYFVPAFFLDPSTFGGMGGFIDGMFNWNSAWPMGNTQINDGSDQNYMNNLQGKSYMAAVSPCFFTHYSPQTYNKNFIYRSDDWLLISRFEILIANRDRIAFAEIISWNDFGESHYVGNIAGAQPNSQAWVNGFDHTGWLDVIGYYATAFRTGTYPAITRDRVFLWARKYPANANAYGDDVGRPTGWDWTQDNLYALVLLTSPADVTLLCGSLASQTFNAVGAGRTKLKLAFAVYDGSCQVRATVRRNGRVVLDVLPSGFVYEGSGNVQKYNFNYFVASG